MTMLSVVGMVMLATSCMDKLRKLTGNDQEWVETTDPPCVQADTREEPEPLYIESVEGDSEDDGYTPVVNAIKAGSDGGEFRQLESGEIVYIYPVSEIFARNIWVEDTDGTVYYMDVSGCRMPSSQAPDGFFTDGRGAWDQQRQPVKQQIGATAMNHTYNDSRQGMESDQWIFHVSEDGSGTAEHRYSFGSEERFNCASSGVNTFTLVRENDDFVQCHVVLMEQGRQVRISGGGQSKTFYAE